jgi:D-glycero-D-manno-heptose 1,7-bisphosphate phosphatase
VADSGVPKLVILDRDGVINVDSDDYIKSVAEWEPIEASLSAIAALSRAGYTIAVATNQSGIGRGLFPQSAVESIHNELRKVVAEHGGRIDGIYYCPHVPDAGCDCRKPRTGLLEQAARELGFRPEETIFIGDTRSDLEAAWAFGARPILVQSGIHRVRLSRAERSGLEIHPDLSAAVSALLSHGAA